MIFYLQLNVSNRLGSLERVLGVIRFRGFDLVDMSVHGSPATPSFFVGVKVQGSRAGENLRRQLEKLEDVFLVELFTVTADPIASQPLREAAVAV